MRDYSDITLYYINDLLILIPKGIQKMNIITVMREAGLQIKETELLELLTSHLTVIHEHIEARGDYNLAKLEELSVEVDKAKTYDEEYYGELIATFPNGVEWLESVISEIKEQLANEYPITDVVAAVCYLESVGFWFHKDGGAYGKHRRSLCQLAHMLKTIDSTECNHKEYLQTYHELYLPSDMNDNGKLDELLTKIYAL